MMSDSADIYEKAITGPDTTLKTSYMSRPTQSGAIVTLFGASSLHGREILYHIGIYMHVFVFFTASNPKLLFSLIHCSFAVYVNVLCALIFNSS